MKWHSWSFFLEGRWQELKEGHCGGFGTKELSDQVQKIVGVFRNCCFVWLVIVFSFVALVTS